MAVRKSEEVIDEICHRIAGGETLRAICRDKHMPSFVAVYDWLAADDDFSLRMARARETGFDAIANETLEIADDSSQDRIKGKVDQENIQRSKLRIWTRMQLLSKWCPKRYGELKQVDIKSTDGSMTPVPALKVDVIHAINGALEDEL